MRFPFLRIRFLLALSVLFLPLLLAGCSGGKKSGSDPAAASTASPSSRGAAHFTIRWPQPAASRLIPLAASSIGIVLSDASGKTVASQIVVRPPAGQDASVISFPVLPVGQVTVVATAYPNADGTGTAQASGTVGLTIVADQNTDATLTMGSTIASVVVASSASDVTAGDTLTFTATALDVSGAVVLTSGSTWAWSSDNTNVLTVSGSGPQITATGLAAGSAHVHAVETESNQSAHVGVTVAPRSVGSVGLAKDAPWPKLLNNARNTARSASGGTQAAVGTLKWQAQIAAQGGGISHSAVVGADGTVYVGSADTLDLSAEDPYLYALHPDGSVKWKYPVGLGFYAPVLGANNTVYVGARANAEPDQPVYVYALNAATGILRWKHKITNPRFQGLPSPNARIFTSITSALALASDGTVYVGASDRVNFYDPVASIDAGYIVAINSNGTQKWLYEGRMVGNYFFTGSIAIGADETLYIGSNISYAHHDGVIEGGSPGYFSYVNAINPDGTLKWSYLIRDAFITNTVLGADGTVYAAAAGGLYALDPSGSFRWKSTQTSASAPAIGSDGTLYFTPSHRLGSLVALNPDGNLKWKRDPDTDEAFATTPALGADGTLYIGGRRYLGNSERPDEYLFALNSDGTTKWKTKTGKVPSGSYVESSSPSIGADGTVYLGFNDGYLYAVQ